MKRSVRGAAIAAVAIIALPPAGAIAAPVTVRVESAAQTLVPTTAVDTTPGTFTVAGGGPCSGTSLGGALQLATGGDWGGRADAQGQRVETIRGETHLLGAEFGGAFWSLYVNERLLSTGACNTELAAGDEVLIYPQCAGAGTGCFAGEPLDLAAPAVVRPGVRFAATVTELTTTFNPDPPFDSTTAEAPSAGATVSAPGVSATTDAAGQAILVLSARGPATLTATKGDRVRESVTVCVTDGADGACGTTASAPAAQGVAGVTTPAPDRTAPSSRLLSPRNGVRYLRSRFVPRTIRGRVAESGSGILSVKLKLTRRFGDRCSYFSGRRERFINRRCRQGFFFKVSEAATFDYLLPGKLPRGRYVLDVVAVDKASNRDTVRQRGRNRAVFEVR